MPDRPLRWPRLLAIAWGAILLFWLPIEDVGVQIVLVMGALSVLAAALVYSNKPGRQVRGRKLVLIAALSGLAVTPTAAILMLFKGGLHGHEYPDFDLADIIDVLAQTPVWMIAGFMIGAGVALIRESQLTSHTEPQAP
jgi:hypothetical protein